MPGMRRREFVACSAARQRCGRCGARAAAADAGDRVSGPGSAAAQCADACSFFQRLRELGWVEGRNVAIDIASRKANDRLPEMAAELVRREVDVIVATGAPDRPCGKAATSTIPIVFARQPIRSVSVSSPSWRGRAATSPACQLS